MPVTAADIEAEHYKALDSLTKEQRWALYRVQRAYQESHFNHRKLAENLEQIFADEAKRRNEAELARVDHEVDAERATD
jgi:hypothetical protein